MSFFQNLKENINKEIEKNPELKKTLQDLKDNEALSKAGEAAREASAKVSQAATQAADVASKGAAQAADAASERAAKAAQMGEEIASKAAEQAKQAQQAASEASQQFTGASAAGEQSQQQQQQQTASSEGAGGEGSSPPLYARLLADFNKAFDSVKQSFNSATASPGSSASGATASAGEAPPGDGSGESTGGALVIREPTFWERNFNPESPFFDRVCRARPARSWHAIERRRPDARVATVSRRMRVCPTHVRLFVCGCCLRRSCGASLAAQARRRAALATWSLGRPSKPRP